MSTSWVMKGRLVCVRAYPADKLNRLAALNGIRPRKHFPSSTRTSGHAEFVKPQRRGEVWDAPASKGQAKCGIEQVSDEGEQQRLRR
jgi:hypothetical protein